MSLGLGALGVADSPVSTETGTREDGTTLADS